MRKTAILFVSAAVVAALPTIASAKSKHHRHHHRQVVQPVVPDDRAGPRFVANALRQIIVPLEVTLTPRAN
jgi:hypothetical protein